MKKRYFVNFEIRHTSTPSDDIALLVEQLRYAQLIQAEQRDHETAIRIECPHGMNGPVWTDQNIRRMASFGIKATAIVK